MKPVVARFTAVFAAVCGTLLCLIATAPRAATMQPVDIPANALTLTAFWAPQTERSAQRPAVIALHGCGGLFANSNGGSSKNSSAKRNDSKRFEARYIEYTQRLNKAGYHVLLLDSFTPRGAHAICSVKNRERDITVETRRDDVLAALRWLQARPDVDQQRIALLGWSHGAMTLLTSINAAREPRAQPLAAAVAFYPGCSALLKTEFKLNVPLLLLLGEKDDWTPPQRCLELIERVRAAQPNTDLTVHVYPDSYHGFDSNRPVRFRADVPNGVNKAGVHQGGNPATKAQAQQAMDAFFARTLQ